MYIADMHCDSLSCVSGDKGLLTPYNFSAKHPQLQFTAAFIPAGGQTPEVRRARLMERFNIYLSERERLELKSISSSEDIYRFEEAGARATLFSIEGGGGLMPSSPELEILASGGLAVIGMAWDTNELASSAWDKNDEGLTSVGREFVRRCDTLGLIGDVSHLSDKSFYDYIELSHYPVLATHSNFRDVCPSPRNLTREMAGLIVERGGVIGLNLYPEFLREDGRATADDILRHVDYALENFGENSLGFGFDIDGTDGNYPEGLGEHSSIHDAVVDLLLSRYSEDVVKKIAGENVVRFLKDNLF